MRSTVSRHVRFSACATAAAIVLTSAACSLDSPDDGDAIRVVVGYQSKTINTVTAGTLLRAEGDFEKRLDEVTERTGQEYAVEWQDYDTGAPITTGMIAGKIDIGSMGDYPLLINGSRANANEGTRTEMLSVTGSSPKGSLNMVVVTPDSTAVTIADLRGKSVSASVGSAGHGTLVQALDRAGINPAEAVNVQNQQPQVGASALESGKVDALAQFVAWPGLLVFQDKARLLYDGAQLGVPTLHGVVARSAFADENPDVVAAFLQAQLDSTDSLVEDPLAAAKLVAEQSGLPAEVVYLYNGPGGTDFNPAVKPELVEALHGDLPYLKSIGSFEHELDLNTFVNTGPLEQAFTATGGNYAQALASAQNASRIEGRDPVCDRDVDPADAAELWLEGAEETQPAAGPTCLLKAVRQAESQGEQVRAAYIYDPLLGTRWFADKAVWLRDGAEFVPFTTQDSANEYVRTHLGAVPASYEQAVAEVI
jgi:NitT/TauT family transport system substrate-binding protein